MVEGLLCLWRRCCLLAIQVRFNGMSSENFDYPVESTHFIPLNCIVWSISIICIFWSFRKFDCLAFPLPHFFLPSPPPSHFLLSSPSPSPFFLLPNFVTLALPLDYALHENRALATSITASFQHREHHLTYDRWTMHIGLKNEFMFSLRISNIAPILGFSLLHFSLTQCSILVSVAPSYTGKIKYLLMAKKSIFAIFLFSQFFCSCESFPLR